jgi:hypothetical protein
MMRRDIRGRWVGVRHRLAWAAGFLLVMAGAAVLSDERDHVYLLLGAAPFLVVLTSSLAGMFDLWVKARKAPLLPHLVDGAQDRTRPQHLDAQSRPGDGVTRAQGESRGDVAAEDAISPWSKQR